MLERSVDLFTIDHIDPFMNDMIEEQSIGLTGAPSKPRVRLIRQAVVWGLGGNWSGVGSRRQDGSIEKHQDYWRSKEFESTFDGYWYAWKLDQELGPKRYRGVLDEAKLKQLLARCIASACTHKKVDRSQEFRDAFSVIFGCCLRKMEFILIRSGDYDERTRMLTLRTNKSYTVAHSTDRQMHCQVIEVAYEPAHQALCKLQRQKAMGMPLFPVAETPVTKMSKLIKATSRVELWDQELQWCLHSMRHGGAQFFRALQERVGPKVMTHKRLVGIIHMSLGTLEQTYGVLEAQRSYLARKRSDCRKRWAQTLTPSTFNRARQTTGVRTAATHTKAHWSQTLIPSSIRRSAPQQPEASETTAPERSIARYLRERDERDRQEERSRETRKKEFKLKKGPIVLIPSGSRKRDRDREED